MIDGSPEWVNDAIERPGHDAAVPRALTAALRVHITDPELVDDLVEFLHSRVDAIAARVGRNEVEVSLLGSMNQSARRVELRRRLGVFEASRRVQGVTSIVEDLDCRDPAAPRDR